MTKGIKHEGQMSRRTTRSINKKIWSTKKRRVRECHRRLAEKE